MENYSEIYLSEISDDTLFNAISEKITSEFNGKIITDLKGLDSCYVEFIIDNCKISLHQDHYLGISIFPTDLEDATKKANDLANLIGLKLIEFFK